MDCTTSGLPRGYSGRHPMTISHFITLAWWSFILVQVPISGVLGHVPVTGPQKDWLSGLGIVFLLAKNDAGWKVETSRIVWLS